jgi:hypothetical protein
MFKRNQLEEAIALATTGVNKTTSKYAPSQRLLETDRSLPQKRPAILRANFAFSVDTPGRGTRIAFLSEAFAL